MTSVISMMNTTHTLVFYGYYLGADLGARFLQQLDHNPLYIKESTGARYDPFIHGMSDVKWLAIPNTHYWFKTQQRITTEADRARGYIKPRDLCYVMVTLPGEDEPWGPLHPEYLALLKEEQRKKRGRIWDRVTNIDSKDVKIIKDLWQLGRPEGCQEPPLQWHLLEMITMREEAGQYRRCLATQYSRLDILEKAKEEEEKEDTTSAA